MAAVIKHRINRDIRVPEVRVIHGEQNKIMPTQQAILLAQSHNLDLIEISPSAKPPVCKIEDYGKFLYHLEKSKAAHVDKAPKLKILQLHVNTGQHDFEIKVRQAKDFLHEKHPVLFKLMFRGRENVHKEMGEELLRKTAETLKDVGTLDGAIKVQGKNAQMRLVPKKH